MRISQFDDVLMICFYSYLVVCYSLFSTDSNLGLQFPSPNLPNSLRVLSVSHSESGRSCDGFYQQSCWGRCHRSFPKSPTRPLRDGSLCWNSPESSRVQQDTLFVWHDAMRCDAMRCASFRENFQRSRSWLSMYLASRGYGERCESHGF